MQFELDIAVLCMVRVYLKPCLFIEEDEIKIEAIYEKKNLFHPLFFFCMEIWVIYIFGFCQIFAKTFSTLIVLREYARTNHS